MKILSTKISNTNKFVSNFLFVLENCLCQAIKIPIFCLATHKSDTKSYESVKLLFVMFMLYFESDI